MSQRISASLFLSWFLIPPPQRIFFQPTLSVILKLCVRKMSSKFNFSATLRKRMRNCSVLPCKSGYLSPEETTICRYLQLQGYDLQSIAYLLGTRIPEQVEIALTFPPESLNTGFWSVNELKLLTNAVSKIKLDPSKKSLTISAFWKEVAIQVGTRTPIQCRLTWEKDSRVKAKKHLYTKEEDLAILKAASASTLSKPTGILSKFSASQINLRYKVLSTNRSHWSAEELLKLENGILLFGPSDWNKVGDFVKTRRVIQCQHRWVPNRYLNSCQLNINTKNFSQEEKIILDGLSKRFPNKLTWLRIFFPGRSLSQFKLNNEIFKLPIDITFPLNSELFALFLENKGDWQKMTEILGSEFSPQILYERIRIQLINIPKLRHARLIHDKVKILFEELRKKNGPPRSWK